MKILVTGAAGFIGSSIASRLHKLGHRVLGVDSFSSYYSVDLKQYRKAELLDAHEINFRRVDLSDDKAVQMLFSEDQFNVVIHLAAQPGVRVPLEKWGWYKRDNLDAFSSILLAASKNNVSNFLYASSSSVYGSGHHGRPLSEINTKPNPVSLYGATKLSNEILANSFSKQIKMRTRGLRLFTVYGPWGRPDMIYFRMVASAFSQTPFNFYGDGNVSRDFTFIEDVSSTIVDLMSELDTHEENFSDIVNVGGGKPISINMCLSLIEEIIGCKVPYNRLLADNRDVDSTNADFTYLNSLIGKFPTTSEKIGFSEFVNWAKSSKIVNNLAPWTESVN
jgi:UDP-glucuronate 4-epimerase